jgi:Protein of unknown function (DUF3352)
VARLPLPRLPRRPSFAGITRRLRDAGYAIGDLARGVGGTAGRLGRGAGRVAIAAWGLLRDSWLGLSIYTRRRIGVAGGVVAAIVVLVVVAVPALPCEAPGGDTCPPGDDAIKLVPADVLAYVHVNLDPGTEQFQRAAGVASRLPTITSQLTSRLLASLPGPRGSPPDFGREIEPWFGGEAALAIIPAGAGAAEEVELLEVDEPGGARRYARSTAAGKPRATTYRGVRVRVDRRGLATAVVGGFLAIGGESGVRDVIDSYSGVEGAGTLADDPAARAARAALPALRFADAYLSEAGIAELVSRPRGLLATLASVIDPGASTGAAAALVADDEGLELALRSELDADRAAAHPGFFSAFSSFRPALASSLPSDSLGYLGIADPGETLRSLLAQARAEEPGLAATAGRLVDRVRKLGGVDLERDLLPSLGGEAAFALEPAPRGKRSGGKRRGAKGGGGRIAPPPGSPAGPTPPTAALRGPRTPVVEFVGSGIEAARARRALARLQGPISKALNPSSERQAPVFVDREIEDVIAHSLRLSPTVDLTYAVDGSVLVVATDPAGVQRLVAGESGLDDADLFDRATEGLPDVVSLLGYLNLGGLIALGERAGLAEDPAYATFAPEIRAAEALGLAIRSSPQELWTDIRLIVGQPARGGETGAHELPPVD